MKRAAFTALTAVILAFGVVPVAQSEPYQISLDGDKVVRLKPMGDVDATSFDDGLLTGGSLVGTWTATTGSGGGIADDVADFSGFIYQPVTQSGANVTGGANLVTQYTLAVGESLDPGESLTWIQVVETNVLILGATASPHLDNLCISGCDSTKPFYPGSSSSSPLPINDTPKRDASKVTETGDDPPVVTPVTWDAKLYPAIWDGTSTEVEVRDGVSWGWTMTKAMVGSTDATFTNPTPDTAVVSGVGTNEFFWGGGDDPGSMTFVGQNFNAGPGLPFTLGTLTFHNGVTDASFAETVVFNPVINFTYVEEQSGIIDPSTFTITNTENIPTEENPDCCADVVVIPDFANPGGSFTFNIPEDSTQSVDLMALLSTTVGDVDPLPSGDPFSADANPYDPGPFDPPVSFTLSIVGLSNPSPGGTIGYIPEPSTITLNALALAGLVLLGRRRSARRRSA